MHPTVSYELTQARIADLRRRAQPERLARAAAHVPPSAPPPDRKRIPFRLRLWSGIRHREWQATTCASSSR
jgi:hypothetical protein